jgi:hypothetical protein
MLTCSLVDMSSDERSPVTYVRMDISDDDLYPSYSDSDAPRSVVAQPDSDVMMLMESVDDEPDEVPLEVAQSDDESENIADEDRDSYVPTTVCIPDSDSEDGNGTRSDTIPSSSFLFSGVNPVTGQFTGDSFNNFCTEWLE